MKRWARSTVSFLKRLAWVATGGLVAVMAILRWMFGPPLPPLAEHPGGVTFEVVAETFRSRVNAEFPLGLSEDAIKQELQLQGFTVSDGTANFLKPGLVCAVTYTIHWISFEGKLKTIDTNVDPACL